MRREIAGGVLAAGLLFRGADLPAQAPRLGAIDFPTSGSARARPLFVRGVLYLHSFEYADAAKAFRQAQAQDPGFAMAYWGEALTYTHPIWNEQDLDSARAVLARLGPTPASRRARARTAREQAYLDALEALYGEGSKPVRDTAYAGAMEQLTKSYPKDLEAKAFYALALLGLSQGVRNVPAYMRAAAIADTVFRANPNHPGAAHYLIHAFDDPVHAPLGLPAARAYSRIAPDAAHAQHMTTHIFVALGMWDQVVSQNAIAVKLTREVPGHYTSWLNYGLLQQGRYAEAARQLEAVRGNMESALPRNQRSALAWMRAHYLVNTESWDSPIAGWSIELNDKAGVANVRDQFVLGLAALRRGDRVAADSCLAGLTALQNQAGVTKNDESGEVVQVGAILTRELGAALRLADASVDEALSLMREATALEDAMPVDFGPPQVIKPSHELLGEMLLEIGRPGEAQREFTRALQGAPSRARSLIGLVRAAAAAGDPKAAARAYRDLQDTWHAADAGRPELAELGRLTGEVRPEE